MFLQVDRGGASYPGDHRWCIRSSRYSYDIACTPGFHYLPAVSIVLLRLSRCWSLKYLTRISTCVLCICSALATEAASKAAARAARIQQAEPEQDADRLSLDLSNIAEAQDEDEHDSNTADTAYNSGCRAQRSNTPRICVTPRSGRGSSIRMSWSIKQHKHHQQQVNNPTPRMTPLFAHKRTPSATTASRVGKLLPPSAYANRHSQQHGSLLDVPLCNTPQVPKSTRSTADSVGIPSEESSDAMLGGLPAAITMVNSASSR